MVASSLIWQSRDMNSMNYNELKMWSHLEKQVMRKLLALDAIIFNLGDGALVKIKKVC